LSEGLQENFFEWLEQQFWFPHVCKNVSDKERQTNCMVIHEAQLSQKNHHDTQYHYSWTTNSRGCAKRLPRHNLNKEDAMDRSRWKKLITTG